MQKHVRPWVLAFLVSATSGAPAQALDFVEGKTIDVSIEFKVNFEITDYSMADDSVRDKKSKKRQTITRDFRLFEFGGELVAGFKNGAGKFVVGGGTRNCNGTGSPIEGGDAGCGQYSFRNGVLDLLLTVVDDNNMWPNGIGERESESIEAVLKIGNGECSFQAGSITASHEEIVTARYSKKYDSRLTTGKGKATRAGCEILDGRKPY